MVIRGAYLFVIAILAVSMFSFGYMFGLPETSSTTSSSLNYEGYVCISKNGELIECSHNLLYSNGKNMTRDYLGAGSSGAILNISLCNATSGAGCGTPVAAGTETFSLYTSCGLNSAQGTYGAIPNTPGNWSVAKTFTATCDSLEINSTRLTNTSGAIFAGNTFSVVTLQTNDQLTINWTLMVS